MISLAEYLIFSAHAIELDSCAAQSRSIAGRATLLRRARSCGAHTCGACSCVPISRGPTCSAYRSLANVGAYLIDVVAYLIDVGAYLIDVGAYLIDVGACLEVCTDVN